MFAPERPALQLVPTEYRQRREEVRDDPTHFAVTLEYRRNAMPAPRVLAMGADHVALRVREVARHHCVPIVENEPLSGALSHGRDRSDHSGAAVCAVAEVLAYLVRIKQLML